jgi:hypothetical protein
MTTYTSSLDKNNLLLFQSELKNLTKEGFLSGYLVVDKNQNLHQASRFRVLWENIREYLGLSNRADASKVKKAASKLILRHCNEINNQEESAKLVIDLAKKTGLINKQEQEQSKDKNQLVKIIIQNALQISKTSKNTNLVKKNIKKVTDSKKTAIAPQVILQNSRIFNTVELPKDDNFQRENKNLSDEGNASSKKEDKQPREEPSKQVIVMDKDVVNKFVVPSENKLDVSKLQIPEAQPISIERSIEEAKLSRKDPEKSKPSVNAIKIDLSNESESNRIRIETLAKGALAILGALGSIYAFSNAMGLPKEIPQVTNSTTPQDANKTFTSDGSLVYPLQGFPSNEGFSPIVLETAVEGNELMQSFDLKSLSMGAEHSQKVRAFPIGRKSNSKEWINSLPSTTVSRIINASHPTLEECTAVSQRENIDPNEKIGYTNLTLETSTENVSHSPPEETLRPSRSLSLSNNKQEPLNGDKKVTFSKDTQKFDDSLVQENNYIPFQDSFTLKGNSFTQKWNTIKEAITTNSYVLGLGLGVGLLGLLGLKASRVSCDDFIQKKFELDKTNIINTISGLKKNNDIDLNKLSKDIYNTMLSSENSDINLDKRAEIIQKLLDSNIIANFFDPDNDNSESSEWLNMAFTTFMQNYLNYQKENPTKINYDNLCLQIFKIYRDKCHPSKTIYMVKKCFFNIKNEIAKVIIKEMSHFYLLLLDSKGIINGYELSPAYEIITAIELVADTVETILASKHFFDTLKVGLKHRISVDEESVKKIFTYLYLHPKAYQLLAREFPELSAENILQPVGESLDLAVLQLYEKKDLPKKVINQLFSMSEKQKNYIAPIEKDLRKLYNVKDDEKYKTTITSSAYAFLKDETIFPIDYESPALVMAIDSKLINIPFSILAVLKNNESAVQKCCRNKLQVTPELLQAVNDGMGEKKSEVAIERFLNFLDQFRIPEDNFFELFRSFRSCEAYADIPLNSDFHRLSLEQMAKVKNSNYNKDLYEYALLNAPKDQPLLKWLGPLELSQELKTKASFAINKYSLPLESQKKGYNEALSLREACFTEPCTIGSLVCCCDTQGVFSISDKYVFNAKLIFSSEKFESNIPKKRLQEALVRLNQEILVANCEVYFSLLESIHTGDAGDTFTINLGENGKFYSSKPDSFPSIPVNFASSEGRSWCGRLGVDTSLLNLSGEHKLKFSCSNLEAMNDLQKEAIRNFIITFDEETSFDNNTRVAWQAKIKIEKKESLFAKPFLKLIQQKWIENSPKEGFEGNFEENKKLLIELFTKQNINNKEVAKFLKHNGVKAEGTFLEDPKVANALQTREPKGVEEFYKKNNIFENTKSSSDGSAGRPTVAASLESLQTIENIPLSDFEKTEQEKSGEKIEGFNHLLKFPLIKDK